MSLVSNRKRLPINESTKLDWNIARRWPSRLRCFLKGGEMPLLDGRDPVLRAFSLGSELDNLSCPTDNKVFADFK
jgi:hypothetical protein